MLSTSSKTAPTLRPRPPETLSGAGIRSCSASFVCRALAAEAEDRPSRPRRGSGDEREGVRVARTHDAEVAIVQRREDGDPPEFGDRNDAGVDQAQAQVGVALDQVDAALVVGNTEVDHVRAPAVTNRRNRTSAAGPSRDSTSQAVSGTTGAGTTSSLWCSRSSPAQAAWQGSSVSAAETSTPVVDLDRHDVRRRWPAHG